MRHGLAFRIKTQNLYDRSVARWRESTVQLALAELRATVNSSKISAQTAASASFVSALHLLSSSTQKWAYFSDQSSRTGLVQEALSLFVEEVCRSMSCDKSDLHITLWDLYFLRAICVEWGDPLTGSVNSLAKLIRKVHSSD